MIKPLVNADEWAKKYDITEREGECPKCKIAIKTTIPFAIKGYRGLVSEDHGCGEKYTRKSMVPVDSEEIEFWNSVI